MSQKHFQPPVFQLFYKSHSQEYEGCFLKFVEHASLSSSYYSAKKQKHPTFAPTAAHRSCAGSLVKTSINNRTIDNLVLIVGEHMLAIKKLIMMEHVFTFLMVRDTFVPLASLPTLWRRSSMQAVSLSSVQKNSLYAVVDLICSRL